MGLTERISEWAVLILEHLHYPGLTLLMALESMIAPVPSEAVMPFAGFLVAKGSFTFAGAVAASSLGTILGSWAGYLMGRYGGYPLVTRWGKYLFLDKEHLDWTVRWFVRRGELTILISRFIPVVRHFISIPAGAARMSLLKFTVYTLIGGTLWNTFLLYVGIKLRERWEVVQHYSHQIDIVVVVVLGAVAIWWIQRELKRRRTAAH
jgi:membrane protein DedA with SNARE-associated domain